MYLGAFYGLKLSFELKIDDIMQKSNRLGFRKMPFKSWLSLCIIKIIARKDKRFWSENDKIGNHYGSKTGNFLHLKLNSSKSLRNWCECALVLVRICVFKICSQGKNSKLGKIIQKGKIVMFAAGLTLGCNNSVIIHPIKMTTLEVVVLVTDSNCKR